MTKFDEIILVIGIKMARKCIESIPNGSQKLCNDAIRCSEDFASKHVELYSSASAHCECYTADCDARNAK